MFSPSPDNGKLYSLSTQGHSHKVPLKTALCFISHLEYHVQKRGRAEVLYLSLGGGMGTQKDKEKHQRNTGETDRDEEMWMVLARSDGERMRGKK